MLRFMILDDQISHAKKLKNKLVEEFEDAVIVDVYEAYHDDVPNYDIYFLDIDMPGVDGITIGKRLKKKDSKNVIVFVSYKNDLIFDALEALPFYFVRKTNFDMDMAITLKNIKSLVDENLLYIETYMNTVKLKIRMNDIICVDKIENYTRIKTATSIYKEREPISKYYKLLPDKMFGVINQSFIIHFKSINIVTPQFIITKDGEKAYFSRGRYKIFKVLYAKYLEAHSLLW